MTLWERRLKRLALSDILVRLLVQIPEHHAAVLGEGERGLAVGGKLRIAVTVDALNFFAFGKFNYRPCGSNGPSGCIDRFMSRFK